MSKVTPLHLYKWVEDFMQKHRLFPRSGRAVVAFSGGEDSVLLYHILCTFLEKGIGALKEVCAVHIDHGLREESSAQALELLRHYPEIKIIKIDQDAPKSDIELWARKHRHFLLKSELDHGDRLYMGHHIDDSIEWYMRQLFGSSGNMKMGIPLINGPIARPFHCLTKKQISRFVSELDLAFVSDSSNFDQRFQRNFLRHSVLARLYEEFPKGQAHFVQKANQWAQDFQSQQKATPKEAPRLEVIDKEVLGLRIMFKEKDEMSWEIFRTQIKEELHSLSSKLRGETRQNLDRLMNNLESKRGGQGPFSFSGGVKVYCYPQMLILQRSDKEEDLKLWDKKLSDHLRGHSQIPCQVVFSKTPTPQELASYLPFVFYQNEDFSFMGKKALKGHQSNLLFPLVTEVMKERGLSCRPITFIWKALNKGNHRKVKGDLLTLT